MHTAHVEAIFEAAHACRLCAAVRPGSAALGPANGPVPAEILFVGEAPGRLGAGRTGVPFAGDESGKRFERLLAETGLDRATVFVTNALLCLPTGPQALNRRPTRAELAACAPFLAATIEAVDPRVVVTLGSVALIAVAALAPHGILLRRSVGRAVPWNGRTLVPLYHPGRQAALHRSWAEQIADWKVLRTLSSRSFQP